MFKVGDLDRKRAKTKELPDLNYLKSLIQYCSNTGNIWWLDKKYKHHAARAEKYKLKCESIASLFVVPSENHQMTIKAIQTILERVGEE